MLLLVPEAYCTFCERTVYLDSEQSKEKEPHCPVCSTPLILA